MDTFLKIVFIVAFLFIFAVATILLKPFRFHVKRKASTALLKFSYLGYLILVLAFTYLFMFSNGDNIFYLEDTNDPRAALHFSFMLVALLIPNIAIILRKNVKKRTVYNIIFTFTNVAFGIFFLFLIKKAL